MCRSHRTWPSPGPRILAEGSEGSLWILALGERFVSSNIWYLVQSTLLSHVEIDLAGRDQSLSVLDTLLSNLASSSTTQLLLNSSNLENVTKYDMTNCLLQGF